MKIEEINEKFNDIKSKYNVLYKALDIENKSRILEDKKKLTFNPSFYNNMDDAQVILKEIKFLENSLDIINSLKDKQDEIEISIEVYEDSKDENILEEVSKLITDSINNLEKLELETLLSDKYDKNNAIVTIRPGAGGTESSDWAEMLFRMYSKWVSSKEEFNLEVIDMLADDEAGIKNVTFLVKGINSYGYLKSEKGIHRLVRISPFDSNKRRHTSFSSVEVVPEVDNEIVVEINSEDIRVDTFRASGAGGQHVNKTDSAIRITHIPTKIVVSCQSQRSQTQNKEYAMKMLKSKLFELEEEKRRKANNELKGESKEIAWGSQIRSYVFCPYTLVKDHRTSYEVGNINAVMDGKIDGFMYAYLKYIK